MPYGLNSLLFNNNDHSKEGLIFETWNMAQKAYQTSHCSDGLAI